MEQQTWGKRGLITIEHLRRLEDIYKDRERHLKDAHILGNDPTQVERSTAEAIRIEKEYSQKAPSKPLPQIDPHNQGGNLAARHQDEWRFLDELYPPLIEQAEKDGNEERVKEYTKEYEEKRALMEEIHAQEFENLAHERLPEPETPEQTKARREAGLHEWEQLQGHDNSRSQDRGHERD